MLKDNFGRQITYLRLGVTDRCNLRCKYCMPASGIDLCNKNELLTFEEMTRIVTILSDLGVNKLRLTGGEPFVRKDFIELLKMFSLNKKLGEINITTNGTNLLPYLSRLEELNINSINLSIDSLQEKKFHQITRRNYFSEVYKTFLALLKSPIKLKLNVVVQSEVNTDEIFDFIKLTKDKNIEVRFIEEMPFNGVGIKPSAKNWIASDIQHHIFKHYENLQVIPHIKSSTSTNFKIENYKGQFGIIPAFTRSICHDCNRMRITATGLFKNCLFDDGVFNIRDYIRSGATDKDLTNLFIKTVLKKPKNGFEAEQLRKYTVSESMSSIGG